MVNGWFRFDFVKEDDPNKIVSLPWLKGWWFLVLQHWKVGFDPVTEVPKRKIIWAKLPGFPIELWTKGVNHEITSRNGNIYYVDEGSMGFRDKRTAWLSVELDLVGGLLVEIHLYSTTFSIRQKVDYQGISFWCLECQNMRHLMINFPNRYISKGSLDMECGPTCRNYTRIAGGNNEDGSPSRIPKKNMDSMALDSIY